ncbi:MAG: hypothetical protein LBR19_00985 [Bifidobacteriaceae bacterium]|jgi:hypothetical protein|nr:hypothetical protein [Bifidobacteriaceae bacterium]
MGLFNKLLKSTVGEAIEHAVKEVAHAAGKDGQDTAATVQSQAQTPSTQPAPAATPAATGLSSQAAFRSLLASAFPELTVRENLPVAELGGAGKPYDFALFRGAADAAPAAAGVIMLTPHNRDNNRAFKGAKAAAEAAGVPFINFYLHMPNEPGYVTDRIRSLLR